MKDYSVYPIDTDVFFSGAEDKAQITINGQRYIMKFQRNSEVGMTYSYVSEYLGSHIFELLKIPVQDTYLGTYNGRNVVLLKHFCCNCGKIHTDSGKKEYFYSMYAGTKYCFVKKKMDSVQHGTISFRIKMVNVLMYRTKMIRRMVQITF